MGYRDPMMDDGDEVMMDNPSEDQELARAGMSVVGEEDAEESFDDMDDDFEDEEDEDMTHSGRNRFDDEEEM